MSDALPPLEPRFTLDDDADDFMFETLDASDASGHQQDSPLPNVLPTLPVESAPAATTDGLDALPEVALPDLTGSGALPVPPPRGEAVVKFDNLELPSGYRLDPDEWGIDVTFKPATVDSSFATDLEDDEPPSLVELPAELRQFVNSEKASELSPEDVKALMAEVLQEHMPQMQTVEVVREVPTIVTVPQDSAPAQRTHPRVLARRAVVIAWVLLFFFQWKLGLVLLVPTIIVWAVLSMWRLERDVSSARRQRYEDLIRKNNGSWSV